MLKTMITRGAAALRRHLGLWLSLYGIQATFTMAFLAATAFVLHAELGDRPLFAAGVRGDTMALVQTVVESPGVVSGLVWFGVGLAALYGVFSLALAGGVYESLAGDAPATRGEAARRFGAGAAARFWPFVRLWLWSLIGWVPTLVAFFIGLAIAGPRLGDELLVSHLVGAFVRALAPAVVLGALTSLAVDLARWHMVADAALPARKAIWRGLKLAVRRPVALAHYALYGVAWVAVGAIYVALTLGKPWAGAGGALALFALRQLVAIARLGLRLGTTAGQQALLPGRDSA
jgi:hypothetical protein